MLRVLHTSDWHAGKTLFKHDRLPDLSYALEQMEALIDHKTVDVMVIAGDLYDTFHPPSPAIEVLNQFFLALHHRNIPVVMISGNHDSTRLWKSMRDILQLASVHVFDRLQRDAHHVIDIKGQRLCITGLPYPSERQLVRLSDTHETLASQRQHYADKVAGVMRLLTASRPEADFHMLCAHLMISGAEPGHSERALSIADTFAVQPQLLPDNYDYIALGHIHKRQQVKQAPVPTWYCGTPYQIDFGEAGAEKGVHLVDFETNKSPVVHFEPLELLHPLAMITCQEEQLEDILTEWKDTHHYLKLRIHVKAPRKGLVDDLRERLGNNLLHVELKLPPKNETLSRYDKLELDAPIDVYRSYCEAHNLELPAALEQTFYELWESVQ
jgi:DNA repair protein SbcD/Mre11